MACTVVICYACDAIGPDAPSITERAEDGVPAGELSPSGPEVLSTPGVGPDAHASLERVLSMPAMMPPVSSISLATPALIWQDTNNGLRALWEMNGGAFTNNYVNLPTITPTDWRIVASADFNQDGTDDLVWQNLTTGSRAIWLMNETAWSGNYVVLPSVTTDWEIVAAAGFNPDPHPDLVWQNLTTGYRAIWFMNGTNWTGSYVTLPIVPGPWSIVGVGRFSGDAHPDLVWENPSTGQRAIWYTTGGGVWSGNYTTIPAVPTTWSIAGAGDFNADNSSDLIWENLTTGQRAIWYMNGGAWTGMYSTLPVIPGNWQIAGAFSGVP
jgi:hypothetical protein